MHTSIRHNPDLPTRVSRLLLTSLEEGLHAPSILLLRRVETKGEFARRALLTVIFVHHRCDRLRS